MFSYFTTRHSPVYKHTGIRWNSGGEGVTQQKRGEVIAPKNEDLFFTIQV